MFLKFAFAMLAVSMMGASAFANDNGGGLGDLIRQVRPANNGYWQCQASNPQNHHQIYTGEVSYGRHQAKKSALHQCQEHEGHHAYCRVYQCFQVNSGGHGGGGNGHGNRW